MSSRITGISLPKDLIERIDSARGDIPRSRYIMRLVEKAFEENQDRHESIDRK